MKAKRIFSLLCLLAVISISCKKQALQPGNTAGPTVFYFNGNVNGSPVNITAGVNSYYMYSSYTQDANNVYNFSGSFHQTSCTSNCPNSIQFIINDRSTSAKGGPVALIDSSLVVGSYSYLSPSGGVSTSYQVIYTPAIGSGTASNYSYKFGDGNTYTGGTGSQIHIYTHPGPFTTNLIVNFASGCIDSVKNVSTAGTTPAPNSGLTIFNNDTTNATITFYCDTLTWSAGSTAFSVNWNFGDGNTATQSFAGNPTSMVHHYASPGLYQVSATVNYYTSPSSTSIIKVIARDSASLPPTCYISSLKDSILGTVANPKAFSNVSVLYTNSAGVTFSSSNIAQTDSATFQVTSVAGYQNNENGQTTKMLHIKFTNCLVKDGSGNTMTITNGDAVIGVAYK